MNGDDSTDGERRAASNRRAADEAIAGCAARGPSADWNKGRLRGGRVWSVRRADERRAGELLPGSGASGERCPALHDRGCVNGGSSAPDSAVLSRERGSTVRDLHTGHDSGDASSAGQTPNAHAGTDSGRTRGESLPLHRLYADLRGRTEGC